MKIHFRKYSYILNFPNLPRTDNETKSIKLYAARLIKKR